MTTPKIFKSQTLDFGPAMPLKLSKKPTENEPHVAKMRWFNLGSWTAVVPRCLPKVYTVLEANDSDV